MAEMPIVEFEGGGLDPGTFEVTSLEGFEEISGLYRFRLQLWSSEKKVKIEDMLSKAARIGLYRYVTTSDGKPATALYNIYGMPSSFEQLEMRDQLTHYSVEVVPRLWRLTRTSQSRIWQNLSVPTIVEKVLTEKGSYDMAAGKDFSKDGVSGSTQAREYTVQYQETDFAFLSRLLEHEGIFYLFTQGEDREKVVFADDNAAFEPIVGSAVLKHKPKGFVAADSMKAREEEVIMSWVCRQTEGPAKVQLSDWNPQDPEVNLVVEEPVDAKGKGKVYEYGNHYKTPSEGKALAKIRAQAILCRLKRFEASSNCRRLRAGARFTLEGHYRDDFNGDYVVISIHHRITQPQHKVAPNNPESYENSFVCIPAAAVFRPERRTPAPKIQGLLPGLVHAPDDAESPEIDADGSYRVKFPFDILKPEDASAPPSRPIRMAQPSSGPDHGFHIPLRGKTEAVVAFNDGDPDRPMILSSAPNAKNGTPVKADNKSQQMWKGQAGNTILFDEKKDSEKIFIYAQKDMHVRIKNDRVEWIGRDAHLTVKQHLNEKVEGNRSRTVKGNEMVQVEGDSNLVVKGKTNIKLDDIVSIKYGKDVAVGYGSAMAVDCSGDYYIKAKNVIIEASTGITLKGGSSSIVIDGSGVTIKGSAITIDSNSIKMAMGPGASPTAGSAGSVSDPAVPQAPLEADEPTAPGSGGGSSGSGGGGGGVPIPIDPPKPYKPDPVKTHWIEIEVVDQDGNPLRGKFYRIKTPNGQVAESFTDEHGKAKIEHIDSGTCEISFPEIDENDVEPA
jgi:type VI secretion system secreted protein VgrG